MTEHRDPASDHFRSEHWDERYSGEPVWSGAPNGALVAEVAGLRPGRALDVGCGEGADSVWLARQGWQVTALDISARAVDKTVAVAEAAGVHVTGVASALQDAQLAQASFDLVSAMYPVLATTPEGRAERILQELVAPGGTLLFVHHEVDPAHAAAHGFDHTAFLSPGELRDSLDDEWDVVVDDRRERHVDGGAGAGHTIDLVVRARRR